MIHNVKKYSILEYGFNINDRVIKKYYSNLKIIKIKTYLISNNIVWVLYERQLILIKYIDYIEETN